MKLDIQIGNSNLKLIVGKLVSKYKINDFTLNYLAMISTLSLQMSEKGRQSGKTHSLKKVKVIFYVDKIKVMQEEERDGKNWEEEP
jgi:hypothetical protein